MTKLASLAVLLLLVAAAAGCGGDDSTGSSGNGGTSASNGSASNGDESDGGGSGAEPVTTSSLDKKQYVKQASALCKGNREERFEAMEAYAEEHKSEPEGERLEGAFEEVFVPTMEEQLVELRELGAPSGDEQQVEAILTAFERAFDMINEQEGLEQSAASSKQFNKAGALARKYGLVECTYG